jgi:2-octaprenyl-3-methyl-6-methoxy-1,4-benzoquinol hydroxylase/2-octaprenylphenol hydroxylase
LIEPGIGKPVMESNARHFDVAIAGAGMVGAAMAGMLARCGFSVALIETVKPAAFDPEQAVGLRVSAVSPGSAAVLEQAGAWAEIEAGKSCAYRRMHVEDSAQHGRSSAALDFEAPVYGMERLGTIVENDLVRSALWNALGIGAKSSPLVQLYCPACVSEVIHRPGSAILSLAGGEKIEVNLLIGADGAMSGVRRLAGIGQDIWEYNQKGLVCVLRKTQDNPGVAWQRFLPGGPLAFLPLSDGSSSIVWTLPAVQADLLTSVSREEFCAELDQASDGWLGRIVDCGERAAFPLIMRLSECYVANRMVLLGDAAHVVHPLAGQGVNLGLADAAALVETLMENRRAGRDIADATALKRFERWRKSESELMAGGIHGLRALFVPRSLAPLRGLGLRLVSRSWSVKEAFLLRAAGQGRNAPKISRGDSLQSLIHQS